MTDRPKITEYYEEVKNKPLMELTSSDLLFRRHMSKAPQLYHSAMMEKNEDKNFTFGEGV